ncbi:type II toxin-antitoxin system RelE/ParE family toxin [Serratia quinivorans]|uniref:type II toxin-antitoxin system RelE/ParE family toxin n=1 Tax=Serratia quinivorans TaxID=137545 RepID=UPI0021B82DAB|nr:type II toxin-antitoxin system RelE/ParE family toxin [Serratia quinivorans]
MKLKLKWTEPAIADRIAIYDYLVSKNPIAAAEIDTLISAAAARLSPRPTEWQTRQSFGDP